MADPTPPPSPRNAGEASQGERLDSWKEIAAHLKRDVTTVQRWEKREGMPVHRHRHDKLGSVYAFRAELEAWARSRRPGMDGEAEPAADTPTRTRRRTAVRLAASFAAVIVLAAAAWLVARRAPPGAVALDGARFVPLADFEGTDQAAAISRDGRFVAFVSDRDGRPAVWVTQVGTGRFRKLTDGGGAELVNPSLRTLGFTPDGTLVTFWARTGASPAGISVWAVPLLDGEPRPYLEGAAEYDWSADGARLVFHTPGPGDPMYVRTAGQAAAGPSIHSAPEGQHSHFQLWSPDGAFIYFVQGSLPDRLDLWRIRAGGGSPERLTHHDAAVTYPVFLDARTLLYLATDPDGFGPFLHALDVEERVPRRVGSGADVYTSLSASADGRRLVATRTTPKRTLWRVPLDGQRADTSAARRVALDTGNGYFARFGPGFLVHVSSNGTSDTLWKLQDGRSTDLWSAPDARIIGAPAVARDGRRIAFPVRRGGRTALYVVNADGTGARSLADALDVLGSPAWTPGGEAVTVAAAVNGAPRLHRVPLSGEPPAPLAPAYAMDPAWSPAGDLVAFTGPDVGTTFPLAAANADGTPRRVPELKLTRGARHVAFSADGRALLVLRGEIGHKNLWRVELETGAETQVTDVGPEFDLRDFDLSPDGRELLLEERQEQSDVVLIERAAR